MRPTSVYFILHPIKNLGLNLKLLIGIFTGHVLNQELWCKPVGLYAQQVNPIPPQPFYGTVPAPAPFLFVLHHGLWCPCS